MKVPARTTIAVIGGTGAEGGGLALRLAHAGYPVIIGSRDGARAAEAADVMNAQLASGNVSGADSADAAARADIVLMAVPYAGQQAAAAALAPHLKGKILIDATVPLAPPKVSRVQLPEGGSAVAKVQNMLGPDVKVVAAFQNVSAHHLKDLDHAVECDVLVCGDDAEACETVIGLATAIGLKGIYAGPVCNAAAVEALTSVLIAINRRHKVAGSGIRITGI
jgi:NADPH-dependent F420 reductase